MKFGSVILIAVLSMVIGALACLLLMPKGRTETRHYIDTIRYDMPIPKDSMVVRYETHLLPVVHHDTLHSNVTDTLHCIVKDSVEVEIPITQKVYESEDYKAYVSGYMPNLDSINVYRHTIETTITKPAPRFSIGVQSGIGYGIISRQIEPYVGIGINIRLGK